MLPGVQALFGFQLIVVFNDRFAELADVDKDLHLGALVLTAIAISLLMTHAAYQRLLDVERVSQAFIWRASRILVLAMPCLLVALLAVVYLVAKLLAGKPSVWEWRRYWRCSTLRCGSCFRCWSRRAARAECRATRLDACIGSGNDALRDRAAPRAVATRAGRRRGRFSPHGPGPCGRSRCNGPRPRIP